MTGMRVRALALLLIALCAMTVAAESEEEKGLRWMPVPNPTVLAASRKLLQPSPYEPAGCPIHYLHREYPFTPGTPGNLRGAPLFPNPDFDYSTLCDGNPLAGYRKYLRYPNGCLSEGYIPRACNMLELVKKTGCGDSITDDPGWKNDRNVPSGLSYKTCNFVGTR